MGNLSARVSSDVRHDTDPLPDFEATDTATKFWLVYKIE
jgi:putative salt-induced outer membrane protein